MGLLITHISDYFAIIAGVRVCDYLCIIYVY